MADLKDFRYTQFDEPAADRAIGEAAFNMSGSAYYDFGSDFNEALEEFKSLVPAHMRTWDPRRKLWAVRVTKAIRRGLPRIFENAEELFDLAERQLSFLI